MLGLLLPSQVTHQKVDYSQLYSAADSLTQLLRELPSNESSKYFVTHKGFKEMLQFSMASLQTGFQATKFPFPMSPEEAENLNLVTVNLLRALCRPKPKVLTNQQIRLLKLGKDKQDLFKEFLASKLSRLRQALWPNSANNSSGFISLDWRFQIQIASKGEQSAYRPNILLELKEARTQEQSPVTHLMNCNYATLNHITQQLTQALKQHQRIQNKAARRFNA